MSDTIIQQSEFFHTHVYTVVVSYYVDDDFSSFTFKNMFESCQNGPEFFLKEQTLFLFEYQRELIIKTEWWYELCDSIFYTFFSYN